VPAAEGAHRSFPAARTPEFEASYGQVCAAKEELESELDAYPLQAHGAGVV